MRHLPFPTRSFNGLPWQLQAFANTDFHKMVPQTSYPTYSYVTNTTALKFLKTLMCFWTAVSSVKLCDCSSWLYKHSTVHMAGQPASADVKQRP